MWAGPRKSNRYDDHFKAGDSKAITSLPLERQGEEATTGIQRVRALMRREVPWWECVLWLRDENHSWDHLLGRAKKVSTRSLCPSLAPSDLFPASLICWVQLEIREQKRLDAFLTSQDPRTQSKVERMENGFQEQMGHFQHIFQIMFRSAG